MPSTLDYLEFSELAYDFAGGVKTDGTGAATVPIPSGWLRMPSPALDPNGLTAYSFVNSATKQIVVAFRGSVTSHDWSVADALGIAIGKRPAQFSAAEAFTESIQEANPGYTVFVTGHSLGGAEAEDVAAALGLAGVTFAAPGVSNLLNAGITPSAPGLIDYVISLDPVGESVGLSGAHVGTVVTLPPIYYVASNIAGGFLGSNAEGAVGSLTQHSLYSYGASLLQQGAISSNPITSPFYAFGNLVDVLLSAANLFIGTDAQGNITDSGSLNVATSTGTVVGAVSETELPTGDASLSITASLGSSSITQIATFDVAGQWLDQFVTNGVTIVAPPPDPADLNVASDGSWIVAITSEIPGQEITVECGIDGTYQLFLGGDTAQATESIFKFAPTQIESGDIITDVDATAQSTNKVVTFDVFNGEAEVGAYTAILNDGSLGTYINYGPASVIPQIVFSGTRSVFSVPDYIADNEISQDWSLLNFQKGDTIELSSFQKDIDILNASNPKAHYTDNIFDDSKGIHIQVLGTENDYFTNQPTTFVASDAILQLESYLGYSPAEVSSAADSSGNVDITTSDAPPCYLRGTRITMVHGDVRVEELAVGDLVRVLNAGFAPIRWIGWRRIDCSRHVAPSGVWPVRIRAGAFGDGLPHRDLWLSPDHAVYANDVLIPVKHLINGTTIEQVPTNLAIYFHIELDQHDVLFAEGLTAESYLDTGDRSKFVNGGRPITLIPDFIPLKREVEACAPLVVAGPKLDAVRRQVNSRALISARAAG